MTSAPVFYFCDRRQAAETTKNAESKVRGGPAFVPMVAGDTWSPICEDLNGPISSRSPRCQKYLPKNRAVDQSLDSEARPQSRRPRPPQAPPASPVDFRRGVDSLAMLVTDTLRGDPFCGDFFVFRSKRSDRVKILAWDGTGLVLYSKRLEMGRFTWPAIQDGA